jgi:hypothetical protein
MEECSRSNYSDFVDQGTPVGLPQLPDKALHVILQQLDKSSMACTAATCSMLHDAILSVITKVDVFCTDLDTQLETFNTWVQQHSTHLVDLVACSVRYWRINTELERQQQPLSCLPGFRLCEVVLRGLKVQLEPADGCPGVLHDCTRLTALDLQECSVVDTVAAAAAISALPQLRRLRLAAVEDTQHRPLITGLQLPAQLTHPSLSCSGLDSG